MTIPRDAGNLGGSWRRLTPAEASARDISPKAERRINPETGQIITRREYENRRVESMGFRSYSQYQRSGAVSKAVSLGFESASQLRALQTNEMYEALERQYSLHAGGIPQEMIRSLDPVADDFNRAMGAVIRAGEWKFRRDPHYAKLGAGLTQVTIGPNIERLFDVVGVDYGRYDLVKRADWLRLY